MHEEGKEKTPQDFQSLINKELAAALPKSVKQEIGLEPKPPIEEKPTRPDISLQKRIRTYESDVADALAQQQTSLVGMVVAEKKRSDDKEYGIPVKQQEEPAPIIIKEKFSTPFTPPEQNTPEIIERRILKEDLLEKAVPEEAQVQEVIPQEVIPEPVAPEPIIPEPVVVPKNLYVPSTQATPRAPQAPFVVVPHTREELTQEEEPIAERPRGGGGKKVVLLTLSVILILGGIGGGYYLYTQSPLSMGLPFQREVKLPSIVPVATQKTHAVGAFTGEKLLGNIADTLQKYQPAVGEVIEIVPISDSQGSTTVRITASDLITKAKFTMPDVLERSLLDRYMLGNYGTDTGSVPFIIFTTDFFQNAFAGMLSWESDMVDEFSPLFKIRERVESSPQISQGTSSIATFFNIRGSFRDRVVRNRDVREFIGESGEILFLYTFIDKDTILITTSESVISGIVDRVEKATYVR